MDNLFLNDVVRTYTILFPTGLLTFFFLTIIHTYVATLVLYLALFILRLALTH